MRAWINHNLFQDFPDDDGSWVRRILRRGLSGRRREREGKIHLRRGLLACICWLKRWISKIFDCHRREAAWMRWWNSFLGYIQVKFMEIRKWLSKSWPDANSNSRRTVNLDYQEKSDQRHSLSILHIHKYGDWASPQAKDRDSALYHLKLIANMNISLPYWSP